jgi:hypothetical protein
VTILFEIQCRNKNRADFNSYNAFGHSVEKSCTGIERGEENVVRENKDQHESKSLHPLCLTCTPTESTTFDDSGDEEDQIILWCRSYLEPESFKDSSEHSSSVNNDEIDEFSALPLDEKSQLNGSILELDSQMARPRIRSNRMYVNIQVYFFRKRLRCPRRPI